MTWYRISRSPSNASWKRRRKHPRKTWYLSSMFYFDQNYDRITIPAVTSDSSRHPDQDDKKSSLRLRTVVDSIDCLQNKECLSITQLGNLLGLKQNDIENLRPKLQIDDHDMIKPSLVPRSKTAPLDKTIMHARLAHACLNVLKTEENNGVVHDGTLSMSRQLRYACLHWASHIFRAFMCETLLPPLQDFCSNDILRWVKNCKELKELPNAVEALAVTRQYLFRVCCFLFL